MSRLDIVIFGATGFTGKYAAREMCRMVKKYPDLTWGVAGRSTEKLEKLMLDLSKRGEDTSKVRVIIADVQDEASLKAMCSQSKVLVNCCGPYRHFGEPVVKAAIDSKSHYVDVSGEPQFMETMQHVYDKAAQDAGVYVISACGFDSVPNDMGVVFLQKNFNGTLNSVESYLSTHMDPEFASEANKTGSVHYGTWESLVYGLTYYNELKPLRKKMFPVPMPTFKPKLLPRSIIHYRDGRYNVPFPGADNSVVYRTQRRLYTENHRRPVQFRAYFRLPNIFASIVAVFFGAVLFIMTRLGFTRKLLLDHPKLFSVGMVTHEGPSEEVSKHASCKFLLVGEGWTEGSDEMTTPPNKTVVAKVSGADPGYGMTVVSLLYCALTVLTQRDKMPASGGVLTTGAAFYNTDIIEHLNENGMKFEIIPNNNN